MDARTTLDYNPMRTSGRPAWPDGGGRTAAAAGPGAKGPPSAARQGPAGGAGGPNRRPPRTRSLWYVATAHISHQWISKAFQISDHHATASPFVVIIGRLMCGNDNHPKNDNDCDDADQGKPDHRKHAQQDHDYWAGPPPPRSAGAVSTTSVPLQI